jgi:hypothetical protein
MATLLPNGKQYFVTNEGLPLVGGKVYTYEAGTVVPKLTYSDADGTIPNTNPVILDARGEALIFWQGAYKVELRDSVDNVIWTVDDVTSSDVIVDELRDDIKNTVDPAKGAGMVGYSQSVPYPGGTVGGRLLQDITVLDLKFMTLAQIVDVVSRTGAMDVTACIQAALEYVAHTTYQGPVHGDGNKKGGGKVYLPPGVWQITDTLRVGQGTELYGASARGFTVPQITDNTGTKIKCNFGGDKRKWAISSATYEVASGLFAPFNTQYGSVSFDNGEISYCFSINIHDLLIEGNDNWGGIRIMAGGFFDVQRVFVWNVGVGYLFNTCYGGSFRAISSLSSLYGILLNNSNAIECGNAYCDKNGDTWSTAILTDPSLRMVTANMTAAPGGYLPADWRDKSYGFYARFCVGCHFAAQTNEHWDIGLAFDEAKDFVLQGYGEGNLDSNFTFVSSDGIMTTFAVATQNNTPDTTYRYHFGTNCSIHMLNCTVGRIYMGEAINNRIRVTGGSGYASDPDWTWSDVIEYTDLNNTLRVSVDGTNPKAVFGYTNLTEALRRVGASAASKRDWTLLLKDDASMSTGLQQIIVNKSINFKREGGGGAKPMIIVGEAGGGFIYRLTMGGICEVTLLDVNLSFPNTAATPADNALFNASGALDFTFTINNASVFMNNGYSLFGTFAGAAMNMKASFTGSDIVATTPAALLRNSGSAVITSIQAASTLAAGIKAIGTNGWQGTVLHSNFP